MSLRGSYDMCCTVQVEGMDALALKDMLAHEHGIMVRHYAKKLLDGFVRISVGRPADTDALVAALQQIGASHAAGAAAATV